MVTQADAIVNMDERGRLVVPVECRKALGLDGETMVRITVEEIGEPGE